MKKKCESCGTDFEAKRRDARYCSGTCRQRASKDRKLSTDPSATVSAPETDSDDVYPSPMTGSGELMRECTAKLAKAKRLETDLGRLALILARRLDYPGPFDSPSAIAALAKQYTQTMIDACAGAEVQEDDVDDLRDEYRPGLRVVT